MAIAIALITDPSLILEDAPTAHETAKLLKTFYYRKALHETGKTMLVVMPGIQRQRFLTAS